jgi:hypothetical protein
MPKPDKALLELKRQVRLLLALSGRVLLLRSGVWLVQQARVRDPAALQALIAAPLVERRTLLGCFAAESRCEPLSRQHLASAAHALAMLDAHRELLFETPARWLGGARRDQAWLAAQRARVARLSHCLRQLDAPESLIGPQQRALAVWFERDRWTPPDTEPRSEQLAWLCDTPPATTAASALASISDSAWAEAMHRVTTHGPRDFDTAARLLEATRNWQSDAIDAWWPWLAQGIDATAIEAWPQVRGARARAAPPAQWPYAAVQVYVRLAGALLRAPGGSRLNLRAETFARLATVRNPALVAVAAALDQALHGSQRLPAEEILVWTDVVLRLQDGTALPTNLVATAGISLARDQAFGEWLGDSDLLDRYLSLRLALGEAAEVSLRLRQDFAALARIDAQRAFLGELPAGDPRRAQLQRLRPVADPNRTRRRLSEECTRLEQRWRMAQADAALRSTLKRVLGVVAPRWDEAWRDGARLYLAVDQNHAELKQLLRAAAAGQAHRLRQQAPSNAAWLKRATEQFDVDSWLEPPTHAFELRGEPCTLAAERDPLQALRMGLPFDSCLAIDAGCNRHSAIINALDANKWVVYLRDRQQRIVARQLLAVSADWQLLGYRIYTSIGSAPPLIAAFDDYARALAQACGLTLADHGLPETLNGQDWYDDGPRSWPMASPGGRADLLRAYCESLALALPDEPEDELFDEARRWSLAVAGKTEALPNWVDQRASGWRNWRLLEQRYGWPTLCRLLGDPVRRDRYRLERIREAALGMQLRARREFHDPQRYSPGHDLIENALDLPALIIALREVIEAPPHTEFDDYGLAHALLTLMPRWAERATLPELLRALPLLATAFARLRQGLPADCSSCVDVGEHWLLQALRSAWRRAPDPALILRLFARRHETAVTPRWLLALGAREHLQQPAALPVFDPPRHSRAVLRALASLSQRFPELHSDPLLLAATLRHSDPASIDLDAVSWPEAPPWAALGDAIIHWPSLWPRLRRYARRPDASAECDAIEAFWHGQVSSAWRDSLPARAAALDAASVPAARTLADMGNAVLLEQTRKLLLRKHYRARLEPKRAHDVRELLRHADAAGKLGAIQGAWQLLRSNPPDTPQRRHALAWMQLHPDARSISDALIDLPQLPDWAREFLLQQLPSSRNAARYERVAAHPQLSELADLCAPQIWSASSARRLLQQLPDALGERWLIQQLRAGNEELVDDGAPEWYQRLATLAQAHCTASSWLKLYEALPDMLSASLFIAALTPADRAAVRAQLPAATSGKQVWL